MGIMCKTNNMKTLLLVLLTVILTTGYGQLTQITSCVCTGYELIYECTVNNGTGTIWKGTIYNGCPNDQIVLRHSTFNDSQSNEIIQNRTCQDIGSISARQISSVNYSYTSHLILSVSESINNRSVVCESLSEGYVGSQQILLTREISHQLMRVHLINIHDGELIFIWNSILEECPSIHYMINSSNCGMCPDNTTTTTVTCTGAYDIYTTSTLCKINVQPLVCGDVYGSSSDYLRVSIQTHSNYVVITTDISPSTFTRSVFLEFFDTKQHIMCNYYDMTYLTNDGKECDTHTVKCYANRCKDYLNTTLSPCSNSTDLIVNITPTKVCSYNVDTTDESTTEITAGTGYTNGLIAAIALAICGAVISAIVVVILLTLTLRIQWSAAQRNKVITHERTQQTWHMEENSEPNELEFIGVHSEAQTDPNTECNSIKKLDGQIRLETNIQDEVLYENRYHNIDKLLCLDTLLIQIKTQVTPKWYQFGLAAGINEEILDEFSSFPPEECLIEMLDFWLKSCEQPPIWRDVADILKQIGLYLLAERILKIYKTGKVQQNTLQQHNEANNVIEESNESEAGSDEL